MEPWLLIIASTIIGILLVELFCHVFIPSIGVQTLDKGMRRVVFFDGPDTIFQNHGDIFTYVPHSDIRNLTAFFSDSDFSIEYDHHFQTNNFGLVQDTDVVPKRESLLLLGDSFSQGQGAEPWFRLLSPEIDKLGYQPVNGGLVGTGFAQWLKLERYLAARKVPIRKVVIPFISDDYSRRVWNFKPNDFRCLAGLPPCRVEEGYLYRLPPRGELSAWIAKVRTARMPTTNEPGIKARAEALLPASYRVYQYLRERLANPTSGAEQQSRAAINQLVETYGPDNVAFIHLPQKDEIDSGPDALGLKARHAVLEAGGKLFDGFTLCRLTASDYYPNDDHPNSVGYAKIASCVTGVIKQLIRS